MRNGIYPSKKQRVLTLELFLSEIQFIEPYFEFGQLPAVLQKVSAAVSHKK